MTSLSFPAQWVGHSLPGVRDFDATYFETPLASLPQVNPGDDLGWLTPIDSGIEAAKQRQSAEWRKRFPSRDNTPEEEAELQTALQEGAREWDHKVRTIRKSAGQRNVALPLGFIQLMQSDDRMNYICGLSPTGCYFDLSDDLIADPFGLGGHLVRIYSDSQFCVLWYLYLPASGGSKVLAWYPNDEVEYLEEATTEREVRAAANATRLVANDFNEFAYRLWLEGNLYFKLKYGIPLTSTEVAYIASIRQS